MQRHLRHGLLGALAVLLCLGAGTSAAQGTFESSFTLQRGEVVSFSVSGVREVFDEGGSLYIVPASPGTLVTVTASIKPQYGFACHNWYANNEIYACYRYAGQDEVCARSTLSAPFEWLGPCPSPGWEDPGPLKAQISMVTPESSTWGLRVGYSNLPVDYSYLTVGSRGASVWQPSDTSWAGGPDDNPFAAHDEQALACSEVGMPSYSVHLGTLGLTVSDTELAYGTPGPRVRPTRTFNSVPLRSQPVGIFGAGWQLAYESRITARAGGADARRGSGAVLAFTSPGFFASGTLPASDVRLEPPRSHRTRLTWRAATHDFLLEDLETHTFSRYEAVSDRPDEFRLASVSDANGNAVRIGFDGPPAAARIVSLTDAAGRATTFEYPGPEQPASAMVAPDGRRAAYTYADVCAGALCRTMLATSTDLLGTITRFTYDANGNLARIESAGKTVAITWAPDAATAYRVATIVDAGGGTTRYDRGTIVTRPTGAVEQYRHDGNLLTSSTDAWGRTITREYTADGLLAKVNHATATTTYAHDADRNLTSVTDPVGRTTRWTWGADGYPTSLVTADGAAWTFGYDARHNLTSVISPLIRQRKVEYDARGLPTAVVDALGHRRTFEYDVAGQLVKVTDRTGRFTTYTHDAIGRLTSIRAQGQAPGTRFAYDANDRLVSVTGPDGSVRLLAYDACAPVATTDQAGARTATTWDTLLRPTAVTDALGQRWAASYDADGALLSVADPLGHATGLAYDKAGRIVRVTDANGAVSSLHLNPRGALSAFVPPGRDAAARTLFMRNAADEVVGVDQPVGRWVSFSRDALGRVTRTTNARGGRVDDAFDADGRWTSRKHDDEDAAVFTYDADGALVSASAPAAGTTQFARDAEGRVLTITYPGGATTHATFDARGNRSTRTYPSGLGVTYAYDLRDRVSRVSWAGASVDVQRDAAGRIVGLARSNGVTSAFTLDALGRIARIVHGSPSRTIVDLTVSRDGAGNVVRVHGVEPHPRGFTAGAVQATYDIADQIVSRTGASYRYDADGNLVEVDGAASWVAAYDAEHRLVSVSRSGQPTLTSSYDAFGRRAQRAVGSAVEVFRRDEDGRLLGEVDGSGGVLAEYVHVDGRLLAMVRGGQTYFYLFDHLGSTLAVTNGTGEVAVAYGYDVSGRVIARSGSLANRFTFVGEHGVEDEGAGLYLMGRRHYDAVTGRFVQRDPIGFAGGPNLYEYAEGRPTTLIDPAGTTPLLFGAATIGSGGTLLAAATAASVAYGVWSWLSQADDSRAQADRLAQERAAKEAVERRWRLECQRILPTDEGVEAYWRYHDLGGQVHNQQGRLLKQVGTTVESVGRTAVSGARTVWNLWGLLGR